MAANTSGSGWGRVLGDLLRGVGKAMQNRSGGSGSPPKPTPQPTGGSPGGSGRDQTYPGDFRGTPEITYEPHPDGQADPGEVVWAWVPYEEDASQGKDRPALVIGRDGHWLLALPLTSKDHDRDEAQEAREGRFWMDVGSGGWDNSGRPSEVRLDRIVRLDPGAVRREGATLDEGLFREVADGVLARR